MRLNEDMIEDHQAEREAGDSAAAEAADATGEDAGADPMARVAALEDELEAARQEVLYAQAETQNVRRRLEKEAQDARSYAATGFARDILSVADNLGRALDAIPDEIKNEEKWKGLLTGIEATARELESVFEKHGVKRVAAKGLPLDPNHHQAMVEIPSADAEPGTVVQEIQAGYTIKDRLLRPAMVGVAKAPDKPAE